MTANVCPFKGEALVKEAGINHIKTELLRGKNLMVETRVWQTKIQSMCERHNGLETKLAILVP